MENTQTAGRSLDQSDPTFVADLLASGEAVEVVAAWYRAIGYSVEIPATRIRPTAELAAEYRDRGDLYAVDAGGWSKRVEVKRVGFSFSDRSTWRFRDILVLGRAYWDSAEPRPFAIWSLSHDLRAAAVVYGQQAKLWTAREIFDTVHGRRRSAYFSPLNLAVWRSLEGINR